MHNHEQVRTYSPSNCAVFRKTKEAWGGLSNMAPGFNLCINGIHIRTSEALYQSCRFPHMPDVQEYIIDQCSPITAKMKSKKYLSQSRLDWLKVRVHVMKWCLRVKLAQNFSKFGDLLLSTDDMPIVEKKTRRADFWAATEQPDGTLVGMNVLGRLLMELRHSLRSGDIGDLKHIEPLSIPNFLLFGKHIELISDISMVKCLSHSRQSRYTNSSPSLPLV